jgi:exodeoxyribonuclease V beta subunit
MLTFLKAHQDVFGKAGQEYNLILIIAQSSLWLKWLMPYFNAKWILVNRSGIPQYKQVLVRIPILDQGHVNPQPLRWIKLEDKIKKLNKWHGKFVSY